MPVQSARSEPTHIAEPPSDRRTGCRSTSRQYNAAIALRPKSQAKPLIWLGCASLVCAYGARLAPNCALESPQRDSEALGLRDLSFVVKWRHLRFSAGDSIIDGAIVKLTDLRGILQ